MSSARTLELQNESAPNPLSVLTEFLASRKLILVLDNCEHLIDATAQLADALLRAAPGLKILATSREALGLAGEIHYFVPPLSCPNLESLSSVDSAG